MDFWISDWISGFHSGFLDFWISQWISGFQFGFLPTVYEISFVTDPSHSSSRPFPFPIFAEVGLACETNRAQASPLDRRKMRSRNETTAKALA